MSIISPSLLGKFNNDYVPFNSRRVVSIGSSLTSQGAVDSASLKGTTNIGPLEWANVLLNHRMELINEGVSGYTTTQIATLLDTAMSHEPAILVIQNGTNEINDGYESIITTSKSLYDAALKTGVTLIISAIQPRKFEDSGWDINDIENALAINDWKRKYADKHERCYYVDVSKYVIDPNSATGEPLTGMLQEDDDTHYTPRGAFRAAQAYKEVLENLLPPSDVVSRSFVTRDNDTVDYGVVNPNSTFLSATGGATGTGVTGNVPDQFRLERVSAGGSGTAVVSVSTRSSGFIDKNICKIDITPSGTTSASDNFYFRTESANTSVVSGGYYEGRIFVEVDAWEGWKQISMEVRDQDDSISYIDMDDGGILSSADSRLTSAAWSGMLRSPTFQTSNITVRLRTVIAVDGEASGTGTVRFNNFQLVRVDERDNT